MPAYLTKIVADQIQALADQDDTLGRGEFDFRSITATEMLDDISVMFEIHATDHNGKDRIFSVTVKED